MIKGVIFDMDGTMFDTEPISARCWHEAGKRVSLTIPDEVVRRCVGKNTTVVTQILKDGLGEDVDIPALRGIRDQIFFETIAREGVPIKKGLTDLLDFLKQEDIPRVVATSTGKERASFVLDHSGVAEDFDAFIYGDEISASKPAPDIFLAAARAIGMDIKTCLILEDSTAGLLAGKAAGADVIYIPDIEVVPEEAKEGISVQMEDLGEVIDWIKKENKEEKRDV